MSPYTTSASFNLDRNSSRVEHITISTLVPPGALVIRSTSNGSNWYMVTMRIGSCWARISTCGNGWTTTGVRGAAAAAWAAPAAAMKERRETDFLDMAITLSQARYTVGMPRLLLLACWMAVSARAEVPAA